MSDNTGMNYDASPIPGGKPGAPPHEVIPDLGIGTDSNGNWTYESAAASGHVEIEIPSLPGSPNPTERLHARNFGDRVIARMESALERPGYMRTGPLQTASEVLQHYTGVAAGAGLLDQGALSRMKSLSKEFHDEGDQRDFFAEVVKPWLRSLNPERRKS